MTQAIVTGASGFVGTHLVSHLAAEGYDVTAFHRREVPLAPHRNVQWVRCDITDDVSVRAAMAPGADVVFHLAAAVAGPASDWAWHQAVGIDGTEHVIEAAADTGVRRFVHVSSEVVYAERPGLIDEQSPLVSDLPSLHPYTRQKLLAEMAVWRADTDGRLATTIVRPARVLGAGDPGLLGALQNVFTAAAGQVFADEHVHLPVVDVDDLARGLMLAAGDGGRHRAYNFASAVVTKDELRATFAAAGFVSPPRPRKERLMIGTARTIAHVSGARRDDKTWYTPLGPSVRRVLGRAFGPPQVDRMLDSRCAEADLGWRPTRDYRDAVAEAVSWARERGQLG